MDLKRKRKFQKLLGIKYDYSLTIGGFIKSWREKLGPYFFKEKFTAEDVVNAMKNAGMKDGSVVFIQSGWAEFYNSTSSEEELIQAILDSIGPEGTLAMSCMPYIRKNKIFDVRKTITKAGSLAETFRRFPGVKRSIHVKHSVCAIGPKADFLVSEHHLGETPWDEKSPYYKLRELDALVFGMGLGKYWIGTIIHCVESILREEVPYYRDLFYPDKKEFQYIDYDGVLKSYWNYDMYQTGSKRRVGSFFKGRHICNKYLTSHYQRVSNLEITCWNAREVIDVLVALGRKGIDSYMLPSKKGYHFFN